MNSGVYKLKCNTCDKIYTGQTGRNFNTRYKEHIRDIKNNVDKSKYAAHILDKEEEGNSLN
jgi:hypothetical protein